MGQRILFFIFCFVMQIVALVGLSPATAATITVSTTNDSGGGSLRDAISTASAGDTIDFSVTGTILLTSGELLINKNLTISGRGASNLIVSGNNASRVFRISAGSNANISSITIQEGSTASDGGGIWNQGTLTISNVVVSNNQAIGGGGMYNSGTLIMDDSTISGNNIFCNCHAHGGGLLNDGTATLTNVTLTNNTADTTGNFGMGSWGGGIGATSGVTTLSKVTIAGNHAKTTGHGGGIAVALSGATLNATNCTISSNDANEGGGMVNYGTATFTNLTISGNTAPAGGGGAIDNHNQGSITLRNTIVANNPLGGNCSGTITSIGHNLSSDNTCGFTGTGDLVNTDPLLGPLQDNGGPTFTHALLAGSPAIDAADPMNFPTTDQRGVTRPQGIGPDIGAYELLPVNPTQGTIGTEIVISGSGYGSKKGKVLLGSVALKILSWSEDSILAKLLKPLSPGIYDITVQPKEPKGAAAIVYNDGFTVKGPDIDSVDPTSGLAGDNITIYGSFFGTKKGKVTLGGKSCKVLSWTMDKTTGESEIEFVVPKRLTPGVNELKIINGMGSDTVNFTVE